MTQSGNIASNSETNLLEKSIRQLISTNFSIQYTIVDKPQTCIYESPTDGFLIILASNKHNSCILPYFINQNPYTIRAGDNIIHSVNIGDKLELKNINNSIVFISFIAKSGIEILENKIHNQNVSFKTCLSQKSDNRTLLIYTQILDSNKKNDSISQLKILSLVIELFLHQIEHIFMEKDSKQLTLHKEHFDKALLAKKIIEKDLTQNYTIAELTKLVGTNEQYLKKFFKQYFGKTIMHYITDHKMNYAKELIMSGEYRISDVARLIGYKHSTHFTTAFKKHFGFIPNSLRY